MVSKRLNDDILLSSDWSTSTSVLPWSLLSFFWRIEVTKDRGDRLTVPTSN